MNQVFDRYAAEHLPTLAPQTRRGHGYLLVTLRKEFGNREAGEIKPRDVGRFLDVPTAKQHRNKMVAVLSGVFSLAVGKWYIDGCELNPCLKVLRHPSKPRDRYVTNDEFWNVHALAKPSMQLAMELARLTGQRGGDILDMTWGDVHETYIDVVQGKTGKHLGIRITPAVQAVLLRCRQYLPNVGPRWHLIRTKTGQPYTHTGFRSGWQWLVARALKTGAMSSPPYHFHDLRAKCASDKIRKVGLKEASNLLGHEDSAITRRVYSRLTQFVDPLE